MSEKLTYRLFEKNDIGGVMKLWEEESGWGGITEEQFYKWYVNTPNGDCLTALTIDENQQIVGQIAFMPSKIILNGVEKKALRFIAPILSQRYSKRISAEGHPTIEMFRLAMKTAVERNFSLVYAFPAFVWFRITKYFVAPEINTETGLTDALDCYSISTKANVASVETANALIANDFSQDYDALWNKAKENLPIKYGVIRDRGWLSWKSGARLTFETRNSLGELIGYVSIDKKTFLITDALARSTKDFETVIAATLKKLRNDFENVSEIKIMKTKFTEDLIAKFGFEKVDFKFVFWRYSLDKTYNREDLLLENWFINPND